MSQYDSYSTPARSYSKGIGEAVADRTINRKRSTGSIERWQDVALRVTKGNVSLCPNAAKEIREFHRMHHHMRQASLLMSGRHLQHGDDTQPTRNMEVFTNCATAASTFLSFYLLLNGSGVGRCYDDDMMKVDYGLQPIVIPVIDQHHADVQSGEITALDHSNASHLYSGKALHTFRVPDTREGWAKALEQIEVMTFRGTHRDQVLLLDFSDVRPRGKPIAGMQGRPASGPGPLMTAIANIARLRDAGMEPWRAAMYADHYASECVLVGGARRAARMATKTWRDPSVLEFIKVKQGGFLWSANNSVMVDAEFWEIVKEDYTTTFGALTPLVSHALEVFDAICQASYHDRTGEPGIINADRLNFNDKGIGQLFDGDFAHSIRYQLDDCAKLLMGEIAKAWSKKEFKAITNPCGEIVLGAVGGYCVIADVVPYHARTLNPGAVVDRSLTGDWRRWDDDAEDAFRTATRALMRVNLMDSLYSKEVKRTNRIGVGFTGIHEYAWARFGFAWAELVDEKRSLPFWQTLGRFARAIDQEAASYALELGVTMPHTTRTVKPAGTTSKLFGLTEGAHLPAMREYVRWVQFRNGDPLIATYKARGYPVKQLQTYSGTTIVGFPTKPAICNLGMGDRLVTAVEATPEQQYQWLRLLEKWWLQGTTGNQVSYTLKYDPSKISFAEFKRVMLDGQSTVKGCSVMPQEDTSAYEYLPESPVNKHEFEQIAHAIQDEMNEDVGREHLACDGGACPVDFRERKVA